MAIKENQLFIKTTCSICCGKETLSCPYCDDRGITLIEASDEAIIKVISTFPANEIQKITSALSQIAQKKGK